MVAARGGRERTVVSRSCATQLSVRRIQRHDHEAQEQAVLARGRPRRSRRTRRDASADRGRCRQRAMLRDAVRLLAVRGRAGARLDARHGGLRRHDWSADAGRRARHGAAPVLRARPRRPAHRLAVRDGPAQQQADAHSSAHSHAAHGERRRVRPARRGLHPRVVADRRAGVEGNRARAVHARRGHAAHVRQDPALHHLLQANRLHDRRAAA